VEQAWKWIDSTASQFASERVSLIDAAGRVLAADVSSAVDVPSFSRAMIDGFALHANDTFGATVYSPLTLAVVGESLPGKPFAERIQVGEAVRVIAGAPVPEGADAILPAERVDVHGDILAVLDEVPPAKHVGEVGEDIKSGTKLLSRGRRLRPQDLGVLSSIGLGEIEVVCPPRVRIVVTGNELLKAGSASSGSKIADANGPMLASLVKRDGGLVDFPGLTSDDPDELLAAMWSDAEVILVSGGSSLGQDDFAPTLLATYGELPIQGIAMRPICPAGLGLLESRLVILLPGNPLACLCAYDLFAGRAIRLLGGRQADWPYRRVTLPLARKLVSQNGRADYARVRIVDGLVEPLAGGAAALSSSVKADGFILVPTDCDGLAQGALVDVLLYDRAES